jgi:hypothetical protein
VQGALLIGASARVTWSFGCAGFVVDRLKAARTYDFDFSKSFVYVIRVHEACLLENQLKIMDMYKRQAIHESQSPGALKVATVKLWALLPLHGCENAE